MVQLDVAAAMLEREMLSQAVMLQVVSVFTLDGAGGAGARRVEGCFTPTTQICANERPNET